jgi:putative ABC transport system permease protein
MNFLQRLLLRWRLFRDLDQEIAFHLDQKIEELVAGGMSVKEATATARREFGNVEFTKETAREAWGSIWVEDLFGDLRLAARLMRKNPGSAAVAVLMIALGIGANTAIFGLVDSAFLRGMPFREPQNLIHIWTTESDGDVHTPTPTQYQAFLHTSSSYDHIAAFGWTDYFWDEGDSVYKNLAGALVTPNWLPTLGVQPMIGRNFTEDEQNGGHDAVVILSYNCWHTRFHAAPSILGKQLILNRRPVTVIGVLPQSLAPYNEQDIFAPLVLDSYASQGNAVAGKMRVQIIARLKPGATLVQARSEAEVISGHFKNPAAAADRTERFLVEDFGESFRNPGPTVQNARRGLWMTAVASSVVLLIACANVASLLLARAVKRKKEIALRLALGCSRARLVRQLLTESTLLFLFGGIFAVILTRWVQDIVTTTTSEMLPGVFLQVDARVFAVSLMLSLVSALAFGIIPALQATRVTLNANLQDAAANVLGGTHSRKMRNFLVATQVALGMALLVGFGLLLRSYFHVENSSLGYDPSNVLTVTVHVPSSPSVTPTDHARLMRAAEDRLLLMPGVESVAIADSLPMEGAQSSGLRIEAPAPNVAPTEDEIWFVSVSPDYFSTLRVPMLAGRAFRIADGPAGSPVAIVNQTFAKHYFPGMNPIGRRLAFADSTTIWREIVGIVSDFRQRNPEEELRPLAYFPVAQTQPRLWSMAIRVHSASELRNVAGNLSKWLQPLDSRINWELGSMQAQIHDSESLTLRRPIIILLASFGSLALILVIVGVFGVTSYSVAERTREIGIRTALGATRSELARLILRESLLVAALGLAIGSVCAFAVASFFPTEGIGWSGSGIFLYGVSRTDAITYLSVAALLTGVVYTASWAPARRAMRVDPMVALRHE